MSFKINYNCKQQVVKDMKQKWEKGKYKKETIIKFELGPSAKSKGPNWKKQNCQICID